ncbi:hypothetical protein [Rheinheimera sp.]|uniref:hypothetical protein n=1 Tax=Rheinheimera sp. TaxID=1869214 RepID=UPI0027B969FC|nr:hypothetical protein [Rheinheimera sp.]
MLFKRSVAVLSLLLLCSCSVLADECRSDCVIQHRDGNILFIKWIGTDGQTKKAFTIDVPAGAAALATSQTADKNINTGILPSFDGQTPPDLADGEYRVVTQTESYLTADELVTIVTILTYGPGPRGGELLLEVKVVETRTKRTTEQTTGG